MLWTRICRHRYGLSDTGPTVTRIRRCGGGGPLRDLGAAFWSGLRPQAATASNSHGLSRLVAACRIWLLIAAYGCLLRLVAAYYHRAQYDRHCRLSLSLICTSPKSRRTVPCHRLRSRDRAAPTSSWAAAALPTRGGMGTCNTLTIMATNTTRIMK